MAKVTMEACLKQWIPDNEDFVYTEKSLLDASNKLGEFLPTRTTLVLNAAMQGLSDEQKFYVCRCLLVAIAVKAGAEYEDDELNEIIGVGMTADDLEAANTQYFKTAAAQLTDNQLLQLVAKINFMAEQDHHLVNVPFGDIKSLAFRRREVILTSC